MILPLTSRKALKVPFKGHFLYGAGNRSGFIGKKKENGGSGGHLKKCPLRGTFL
jgi:hypothetical protein